MQQTIQISAVIPAYNAQKYIARAIESILRQSRPADEIIVVDDGSTDDTAAVVRSYGDKVRLISQSNGGASAARNAGIRAAKGNWIAFLDADDEWLPEFLEKHENLLKKNPFLVWSTANYITCSCSEGQQSPFVAVSDAERYLKGSEVIDNYFLGAIKDLWGCSDTMMIRKDLFEEAGFFNTKLRKGEDLDTWWRIAYRHPQIGFIASPLAIYHLGVPNSGCKRTESIGYYAQLISQHLILSQKFNRQCEFSLLACKMLRGWVRSMLFEAQRENIRFLLKQFKPLYPVWYVCLIWILTAFPKVTQAGCLLLSKIIRTLHLRRRVVLPPAKT
ncbi:MAG: glycosyltransferase family 2 protein [Phycisphaerae bacterium]|nr:glycosyltransferase family 2 protein [Phycisphaerae bacterium]